MRLVGFILILVVLMVGIGSNLSIMIDIPSAIITFIGALALLLFAGRSIPGMFSAVFSAGASQEQLTEAARSWQLAGVFGLATGGIGTLIGIVIMLKNMDDPAALGPGMAIAILTILYGLFLAYAIALPLASRLQDRAASRS